MNVVNERSVHEMKAIDVGLVPIERRFNLESRNTAIAKRRLDGLTLQQLADEFRLSRRTISNAINEHNKRVRRELAEQA